MEKVLKNNTELLELKPNNKSKKRINRRTSEILFIIAMLLFPTIQFIIFWIVPNFNSIIMGFQSDYDGSFTTVHFETFFNEFKEGKDMLGHYPEIVYSIKNSLIYFAVNIFICTPIVLFFSYVLFKKVPFSGVFKVVFYLPSIIGATVTTLLFRQLFLNKGAPLFDILDKLGFITEKMRDGGLFGNDESAFTMVLIYSIWTCVGLNMIMFHGAMKRIPQEIFESAEIDGVGFFRQFFNIVIPLIWPTITTLIIFSLAGMFISYGSVMILCPDEPTASMIGWFITKWTTAKDTQATMNYPAAVGLIFTVVGLPFVLFVRWLLNKIGNDIEY